MHWIFYSAIAALALAAADILVKVVAGKISDSLAMLLYGTVPFLTGLVWLGLERSGPAAAVAARPAAMLVCAAGVGVMFTTVTFCMYAAFRTGAPISVASPLIRLGGLVVASMVGLFFWKEPVTGRYLVGLALVCAGMYLLLTR